MIGFFEKYVKITEKDITINLKFSEYTHNVKNDLNSNTLLAP